MFSYLGTQISPVTRARVFDSESGPVWTFLFETSFAKYLL
jgi:hypothetical protein